MLISDLDFPIVITSWIPMLLMVTRCYQIMQDGKPHSMSFFLHAFPLPSPKSSGGTKVVLHPCSQTNVGSCMASTTYKCFCDFPRVTLVFTCSAFAICLPAAVYLQPPATLHRSCSASYTLPLVVNTPSPFTRCHNLPCIPVLLPLLLLTTFSAKDPLQEVPPYLIGHRSSFAYCHHCLQLSGAYWERKSPLFHF